MIECPLVLGWPCCSLVETGRPRYCEIFFEFKMHFLVGRLWSFSEFQLCNDYSCVGDVIFFSSSEFRRFICLNREISTEISSVWWCLSHESIFKFGQQRKMNHKFFVLIITWNCHFTSSGSGKKNSNQRLDARYPTYLKSSYKHSFDSRMSSFVKMRSDIFSFIISIFYVWENCNLLS